MTKRPAARLWPLLLALLLVRTAGAQPVRGDGVEVAWLTPQKGAVLDVDGGPEQPVSLRWPRRLPARGWLAAQLFAGEVAWVHLDRDSAAAAVRFAFLSGGSEGIAMVEAAPEKRTARDFLFTAPVGPPTWLGLRLRPGEAAPRAQIWVASVNSPGFRWELWEEQIKAWAARRTPLPPAPPDLIGAAMVDQLALVADAARLAQTETAAAAHEPVTQLLRAEALTADLPVREPLFPYFQRQELTGKLAHQRTAQQVAGQRMIEVSEAHPLTFSLEGPCILRIETRARFEGSAPLQKTPLTVLLRAHGRLLAVAAEDTAAQQLTQVGLISQQRRLLFAAAPGRHDYELQVRGSPAWVSVIVHHRVSHAEDLTTHSEDVPWLLQHAQGGTGVLATLLHAEASFLSLDNEGARVHFQELAAAAHSPRLHAFALLRLAALLPPSAAVAMTQKALTLLGDATDAETARLRHLLVAEHLTRVVAYLPPGGAAPKEAVALLLRTPGALPHMLALVGPLLRRVPGQRSLSLPLLAAAQQRTPLDVALRLKLIHEWFTGSRWAALSMSELAGAQRIELLVPPREASTCADALAEGLRGYVPLGEGPAVLQVPESLVPPGSLHRFHLATLRYAAPRLGWADLTLDGERTRLPLVLPSESIPFALAAGRHTLGVTLTGEMAGALLAPCALLEDSKSNSLMIEQHFSALKGHGGQTRAVVMEPGTVGFLGVELRASPALRGGRLVVRTEQGVLGTIEVDGHGVDTKVAGKLAVGPSIVVVLPLPAATRVVDIVRQDDGAPLLVRALLRRSLAPQSRIRPRLPGIDRDADQLARLRRATRALRQARDGVAQAHARIHRAEVLIALNALTLARLDLELALLSLEDESSLERARALLVSTAEPPLLTQPPGGPSAVMLAAGANLTASEAEIACVTDALVRLAQRPVLGSTAASRCGGILGKYVNALLEQQSGNPARAAQHYAAAYLQSLAASDSHPALARESALQFAENGPGPGSAQALALATAAAQEEDPEATRAIERVHGLSYVEPVRALDAGAAVRWAERVVPPLSLPAALADEPWDPGMFLEARAGKAAETEFHVERPLRVRLETLCDVRGGLLGEGPPCELSVEIDGAAVGSLATNMLRAGERGQLAAVEFDRGSHRIKVALERHNEAAVAFVHLLTSRPLNGDAAQLDSAGYYAMPIVAPPVRRFLGTADEAVKLRVQGPTVLRIDALVAEGKPSRALAVELAPDALSKVQRTYPVCTLKAEQQEVTQLEGSDCRTALRVPLVQEGTYQITLRPIGTPRMALALAVYQDEPVVPPSADGAIAGTDFPGKPAVLPEHAALQTLPPPQSNFVRELGTLQAGQNATFILPAKTSVLPGDTYTESALTYRRKLDGLPIWLQTTGALRVRRGTPSMGMSALAFLRIPPFQLRWYTELNFFTQVINNNREYSMRLASYIERSFPLGRHFFILPRFEFTADYQSLPARPTKAGPSIAEAHPLPTLIDSSVFNEYYQGHPKGIYGQLLFWWVPFINMITYAHVRLNTNQYVNQLDEVSAQAGFDLALYTTELTGSYKIAKLMADDARKNTQITNTVAAAINQTIWIHRNHRLGVWAGGDIEVVSRATTVQFGLFWEGSHGRGLDDYSTPVTNLPQQLGRGRGFLKAEETLR